MTAEPTPPWYATCKTGDLVFSHGTALTSQLIELSGGVPWSHVGMVVRSPQSGHLCLWEATAHATPAPAITIVDAPPDTGEEPSWVMIPGPTTSGVRLVSLRERVLGEPTLYGLMRLTQTTTGSVFERRVYNFVREKLGIPYEDDMTVLFNSWWDWCGLGTNPPDASHYFCSELVVDTLRATGIMDAVHGPGAQRNQPASEWTVADLAALGAPRYPGGQSPLLTMEYAPMKQFTT